MSETPPEAAPGSAEPAEPLEIEVKLSVTLPRAVRRLIRRPDPGRLAGFEADGDVHLVRLTDRYVDTDPDGGRLATKLIRARLRHHGRSVVLAVKRSGVERDGVTTRAEIQAPATRSLDPTRWPDSVARRALLAGLDGGGLGEIARLRQYRLTRVLRRGDTAVELSLDRVDALDGRRVVGRRFELEAELIEGDHQALAELAAALGRIDGVGPPIGSKLRFALDSRPAR